MFSTVFLSPFMLVPEIHCDRICLMLSLIIHSHYSNRFHTYRTDFWKNAIKPPLEGNMMSEIKYANVMLDMNVTKSGRHLSNEYIYIYIYIYIYM